MKEGFSKKNMLPKIIVIICCSLSFYISCNSQNIEIKREVVTTNQTLEFLTVTKVVDGDTFWVVDSAGIETKIRLIGIDAPESRKVFKKEAGYFGKEAKAYLTELLQHKKLRLEYDVNRTDQYKRTLAYAYLPDGTFINAELLRNGYAVIMTVPPNIKYAGKFAELQKEARENKRGLWAIELK